MRIYIVGGIRNENHRYDPGAGRLVSLSHEATGANLRKAHVVLGVEAFERSRML